MQTVQVLVEQSTHCNQDSLPLRFGVHFSEDTVLSIRTDGKTYPDKNPDRYQINGVLSHPNIFNTIESRAVLTTRTRNGLPIIVTVWSHDAKTENHLSEVMRDLRKSGDLSPMWLLEQHRLYLSHELSTHSDLLRLLAKKVGSARHKELKAQTDLVIQKLSETIEKHKEKAEKLEEENKQLIAERDAAKVQGSEVQVTEPNTLISADEDFFHRGSSCTVLNLADGTKWYMKTSTFDRTGAITEKAKSLIGEQVKVTSWDPITDPGKWSSQGYFRNIYLSDE